MNTRWGSDASRATSSNSRPGELDVLAAHGDSAGAAVDRQLPRLHELVARRPAAPQHRADACEELLVVDRALDHVVDAAVEGAHAVDRVGPLRCEQDHGHLPVPAAAGLAGAQAAAQLELGQQDEVRPSAFRQGEGVAVHPRLHDVEAVVAEVTLEKPSRDVLGLCQQQRVAHADDASHGARRIASCPLPRA